jgi:hypothetical protein
MVLSSSARRPPQTSSMSGLASSTWMNAGIVSRGVASSAPPRGSSLGWTRRRRCGHVTESVTTPPGRPPRAVLQPACMRHPTRRLCGCHGVCATGHLCGTVYRGYGRIGRSTPQRSARCAGGSGRDGVPGGVHRGVWVVDFASREAYKGSVMAA